MDKLKMHTPNIADENFRELELVVNITDFLEQRYFDDGVDGLFRAGLREGALEIQVTDIPFKRLRIYANEEIRSVTVNGEIRVFRQEGNCYLV